MSRKWAVIMCVLLVSSVLCTTVAVSAKKPDKPPGGGGGDDGGPTPTGTIYYLYPDDGAVCTWTMDPDGGSRTNLGSYVGGAMSRETHGDHYWFVRFKETSGTYPDGQARQEVFACRDDGSVSLQLTDDATLATNHLCCYVSWGPDDDFISWSALRWGTDASGDYVYDAGIYTAAVGFDDNGDVTGIGTPTLEYETGYWTIDQQGATRYYPVARDNLDWSPDGEKVVYHTNSGIYVYDSVGGSSSKLADGDIARWSPTGDLIAYTYAWDLYVIGPDGTGGGIVVDVKNTKTCSYHIYDFRWSPDGEFLVYHLREMGHRRTNEYFQVVQTDGSGDTRISNGLTNDVWKELVGWR